MPPSVDAYSVTRACATSTQAIVNGTQAILTGDADIVIAGGADSLSKPPILYGDTVVDALMAANAAKDVGSKVKAFGSVRPKDLAPQAAGPRRAQHRSHDGPVRREDGAGERHRPRGAGRVRLRVPP